MRKMRDSEEGEWVKVGAKKRGKGGQKSKR